MGGCEGEGGKEPRARGQPVAASGHVPKRTGQYACTAAGERATNAGAEAAGARRAEAAAAAGKAVTEARWLAMGSADPHGVGDVDKVKPGACLRGALRLGSQSMATGVELMRRPLPEAKTPWRINMPLGT